MGLFSSTKSKLKWEKLNSDKGFYISRCKVPGGWLITVRAGFGLGVTFMPDPNHSWDGCSLERFSQ